MPDRIDCYRRIGRPRASLADGKGEKPSSRPDCASVMARVLSVSVEPRRKMMRWLPSGNLRGRKKKKDKDKDKDKDEDAP